MAYEIYYTPEFKRDYKRLATPLRELIKTRGRIFAENPFHPLLKTHKLEGNKNRWSFSVDYRNRVAFRFKEGNIIELLRVGDHSIYRKLR